MTTTYKAKHHHNSQDHNQYILFHAKVKAHNSSKTTKMIFLPATLCRRKPCHAFIYTQNDPTEASSTILPHNILGQTFHLLPKEFQTSAPWGLVCNLLPLLFLCSSCFGIDKIKTNTNFFIMIKTIIFHTVGLEHLGKSQNNFFISVWFITEYLVYSWKQTHFRHRKTKRKKYEI